MPGILPPITVSRAVGWQLGVPVTEFGDPVDLTGWTFDLVLQPDCSTPLLTLTGSGDDYIRPEGAQFDVMIRPETAAGIGDPTAHRQTIPFVIHSTQPNNTRELLLLGSLILEN